jgi:hypothetical protein
MSRASRSLKSGSTRIVFGEVPATGWQFEEDHLARAQVKLQRVVMLRDSCPANAAVACGSRPSRSATLQSRGARNMRLNSSQVERALSQFDAHCLPDDHPAIAQLNRLFGEHTYFLDTNGLNVLEPSESAETDTQIGKIVNLAHWSDDTLTNLMPHEPEPTGVIVSLGSKH